MFMYISKNAFNYNSNLFAVIGHLEAIGRHYAPDILRIMQRMPILFCLDGFLRTRFITGNLPIYAGSVYVIL